MYAEQIVSHELVPLRTSDTGEEALGIMSEFQVRHLPIVNNEQLLGLVSEDDILDHDVQEAVGSYKLSIRQFSVGHRDHLFEVMRLIADFHLTVVPVVDAEGNYVGMITQESLLQYFSQMGGFQETGSIIVLEIARHNYSLAEISRIVESENALILSSMVSSSNFSEGKIEVTLKVNVQNVQPLLATFIRFGYEVKASFFEREFDDNLKDRYDALISYLNV
jgi:signal-transduction protein with cAMP-binding, CBS, and nucleotidyltransferase domain